MKHDPLTHLTKCLLDFALTTLEDDQPVHKLEVPHPIYYRLYDSPTDTHIRGSGTTFLTVEGEYSGVHNLFATTNDYVRDTTDVINFVGTRTKRKDKFPAMYRQGVKILTTDGVLRGSALYIDEAEGAAASVAKNIFTVSHASGKFANVKSFTVEYDNTGRLNRKVTFHH